jgi:hypothetical protein
MTKGIKWTVKYLIDICCNTLMDRECNRCRNSKVIQNICHNSWSVNITFQENKLWIWIVRLMIGTGGLACKHSSVTLDQINKGYNSDLLELCQPFKKGWFASDGTFYYSGFEEWRKWKYSELSSTKSSLHYLDLLCSCKHDMLHFPSVLHCLFNIKHLQATSLR